MNEQAWVSVAMRYLNLSETPGKETTPTIARWLLNLKAWWRDDETPWCGVFVAECLREAGHALPQHWYRALAWNEWGLQLDRPTRGCVVTFARQGGGHVGFFMGYDERGRLMVLGGNQGNRVSIAPFDRSRVAGYRWPLSAPLPPLIPEAPLLVSDGRPSSVQEA